MKLLYYATYNSTPLGYTSGKWSHDKAYGVAGKSGWFISFCYPWLGKRYIVQLRQDKF